MLTAPLTTFPLVVESACVTMTYTEPADIGDGDAKTRLPMEITNVDASTPETNPRMEETARANRPNFADIAGREEARPIPAEPGRDDCASLLETDTYNPVSE